MKRTLKDEIVAIWRMAVRYIKLEIDYYKLTGAEKFSILASAMIVGMIVLVLGAFMTLLMSFALAAWFSTFMPEALAYLASSGAFLMLAVLVFLFRKQLITNPISKFITKLFFSEDVKDSETWKKE